MSDPCRIYVGGLPNDVDEHMIRKYFKEVGDPVKVEGPKRQPDGTGMFAFLTFADSRDADDAISKCHGMEVEGGTRLRVEEPKSRPQFRDGNRGGGGRGYRVVLRGLPNSASWQDIKDHMRKVGNVIYANSNRDGTGVAEFSRPEDSRRAVRDLDGTEFVSHQDERSRMTVIEDGYDRGSERYEGGGGGGGRDRRGGGGGGGYDRGYSRDRSDRYDQRRAHSGERSSSRRDRGGGYDSRRGKSSDRWRHDDRHEDSYDRRRDRTRSRDNDRGSDYGRDKRGGYSRDDDRYDDRRRERSRSR
eukprot:GHVR01015049.1.p1 GENE.GHVR01015049.1~~GHVR01015049.1.p1  ORF type:complete len:301 (+),score=86.31 GHVR01015049.1:40-942(+)